MEGRSEKSGRPFCFMVERASSSWFYWVSILLASSFVSLEKPAEKATRAFFTEPGFTRITTSRFLNRTRTASRFDDAEQDGHPDGVGVGLGRGKMQRWSTLSQIPPWATQVAIL